MIKNHVIECLKLCCLLVAVLYGFCCAPCMMCDVANSLDEYTCIMLCTGGHALAPIRSKLLRHATRIEARVHSASSTSSSTCSTVSYHCSHAGLYVLRLLPHDDLPAVRALPDAPWTKEHQRSQVCPLETLNSWSVHWVCLVFIYDHLVHVRPVQI